MKLVTIPLRNFALPVPRTGSIEAHSGYGRAAAEGQEIHLRVQKKRLKSNLSYQAEVPLSSLFERDNYRFKIDGRMDGIFHHDTPHIEEIKSGFNISELGRRLADHPLDHPYCLQLQSYGYFYWRDNHILPRLTFHLVSTRTGECQDLELDFDVPLFEQWLELRLGELVCEARLAEKRAARRRRVAASFTFPFQNPRPGQVELMQEIEQGMKEQKPMLIQAPTGLGKTVGVLYPALKEALGRGQRVVYITPKNSQHSVAEEAVVRFQETGSSVKSLSLTAKTKICFKNEPLCNPDYCEYARNYYGKFQEQGIQEILSKKRRMKARTFRDLGEQFQLCPFQLQLDSVDEADVVICDYNYVFAPRSALGRTSSIVLDQAGKPNLVVDEAHNLPARAMDYYSPALSSAIMENMRTPIRKLIPSQFRTEAESLLDGCLRTVGSCQKNDSTKPGRIDPPVQLFLEQDGKLRVFLSRYLDADHDIQPQDVILRLCFYWSEFTEKLQYLVDPERQEFFATYHPHPTGGTVRITCCDASSMIRECYGEYGQVIAFSATLKPFDYYATLSGLDLQKTITAEFTSPFPKQLRKLLIIPQISTRYSHRERNYARIADAIQRITVLRPGNYFVFLPSFSFLERVADLFKANGDFIIFRQERGMKIARVEAILDHLRMGSIPTIVFAVQGGSFSEGVDYAGDMVIGAFVVGPPLPNFDVEREEMRAYYQRYYGAGFEFAYTIPAMAKAVQAAGRVIRSEMDRGLIVLMDNRFTEASYSNSMPADWFNLDVKELVSESILREVEDFWNSNSP